MKSVTKRITALIVIMMLALILCSCGQQNELYGQYSKQDLYDAAHSTWETLNDMEYSEIIQFQAYYMQQAATDESYESTIEMLNEWLEVYPDLGDFVQETGFEVDKSGKTTTATLSLDYTGRDIQLVYVFNTYDMSINAINIQPIYSFGELMSRAGMNVLMGMGTVFVILIMISLIIYAFNLIPYLTKRSKNKGAIEEKSDESSGKADASNDQDNLADDGELVAVIAAAIAASTGTTTDSFVVRQIRRRA